MSPKLTNGPSRFLFDHFRALVRIVYSTVANIEPTSGLALEITREDFQLLAACDAADRIRIIHPMVHFTPHFFHERADLYFCGDRGPRSGPDHKVPAGVQ